MTGVVGGGYLCWDARVVACLTSVYLSCVVQLCIKLSPGSRKGIQFTDKNWEKHYVLLENVWRLIFPGFFFDIAEEAINSDK